MWNSVLALASPAIQVDTSLLYTSILIGGGTPSVQISQIGDTLLQMYGACRLSSMVYCWWVSVGMCVTKAAEAYFYTKFTKLIGTIRTVSYKWSPDVLTLIFPSSDSSRCKKSIKGVKQKDGTRFIQSTNVWAGVKYILWVRSSCSHDYPDPACLLFLTPICIFYDVKFTIMWLNNGELRQEDPQDDNRSKKDDQ